MSNHIEYKTNFLKNVIFRLDFDELQQDKLKQFNDYFFKGISDYYTDPVSKITESISISVNPEGNKKIEQDRSLIYEYHQKDCNNKIVSLLKNALIFECQNNEYKSFPAFKKDIEFIFSKFIQNQQISQFNRMGLRYVNEINISEINPLNWEGFIHVDLCKAIKAGTTGSFLPIRSMHQLEIKKEEVNILFNYGIFNRDYPNPIAKAELILDYDSYINAILEKSEILDKLEMLNSFSKEMFELSIENKLREKMGIKNDKA